MGWYLIFPALLHVMIDCFTSDIYTLSPLNGGPISPVWSNVSSLEFQVTAVTTGTLSPIQRSQLVVGATIFVIHSTHLIADQFSSSKKSVLFVNSEY